MPTDTRLDTEEAIEIAAFRAVIRSFLRTSEHVRGSTGLRLAATCSC